ALRTHAVEARLDSLRERLRRLAEHGDAIERSAHAGVAREALAARAVAAAAEVLDAARAGLLPAAGDPGAKPLASEGAPFERADRPRTAGLTGGSLSAGAIVATDHPERDARFDPAVDTPESGEPGPLLVVPLRVRDRVLGVARVFPSAAVGASARLAELLA